MFDYGNTAGADNVAEIELRTLLEEVLHLDWNDAFKCDEVTKSALLKLQENKSLLRRLVASIISDKEKLDKCEKDYNIEKYVLFSDKDSGVRLRLHVMHPNASDIPHSHRMNFTSLILFGSYTHTLYSPLDDGERLIEAAEIKPIYKKEEISGIPYFIDHSVIHNLRASEGGKCVSLMLRSSARKQRAIHYDFGTNETWWRYGSQERTPESLKNTKSVEEHDVVNLLSFLEGVGVL